MKLQERVFKQRVEMAIKDLAKLPTAQLVKQLAKLKDNLLTIESPEAKIVSLDEHRRIKIAYRLLKEVIKSRHGWVSPVEPIDPTKPRNPNRKNRSGSLKIV